MGLKHTAPADAIPPKRVDTVGEPFAMAAATPFTSFPSGANVFSICPFVFVFLGIFVGLVNLCLFLTVTDVHLKINASDEKAF